MEIAREATLLNTQVTKLSQASDVESIERVPISLAGSISSAMDMSSKLLNPDSFRVNFKALTDIPVMGSEMLDVAILSTLSFFVRTRLHEDLNITIRYETLGRSVRVYTECVGRELSKDIREFLEIHAVPHTPSIELDIYVTRTIVELFGGTLAYGRDEKTMMNQIIMTLDTAT
jgi:hypothetical protein